MAKQHTHTGIHILKVSNPTFKPLKLLLYLTAQFNLVLQYFLRYQRGGSRLLTWNARVDSILATCIYLLALVPLVHTKYVTFSGYKLIAIGVVSPSTTYSDVSAMLSVDRKSG
jgi:hypothetical protein